MFRFLTHEEQKGMAQQQAERAARRLIALCGLFEDVARVLGEDPRVADMVKERLDHIERTT